MHRKLLTLFFFTMSVSAQQVTTPFDYTQKIHKQIESLKSLDPQKYLNTIDSVRGDLEDYFSHKQKVCNGEFSSVILSGENNSEGVARKLTKEERELCFRELKALQTTYLNNLFDLRKKFLIWSHENTLKNLEKEKEDALLSLKQSFDKKERRARR